MRKLVHIVTAIFAWHALSHIAGEAIHEAAIEIAISPVMHTVEHTVGKVMDGERKLDEASAAALAKQGRFHAHHRTQEAQ